MAQPSSLEGFPKGEFAAFSTAKMTHFLPYSQGTTTKDLKGFFGDNFQYLTKTPIGRLKIEIPNTEPLIVQYGEIIKKCNPLLRKVALFAWYRLLYASSF